ncbi:MBOAT family protein [Longispora albida]|uniref:MBOAT family protein n=1 Tax=Longispora albida TaxID=203523 RepID=UPI00035EA800|nr:MBOAT family protein [Longispora albida]
MQPWQVLVLVIVAVYFPLKILTLLRYRGHRPAGARLVLYVLGWPGFDPKPFGPGERKTTGAGIGWRGAAVMAAGLLTWAAVGYSDVAEPARSWIGIGAILLTVHFGFADVLAGVLRARGMGVRRLFPEPVLSVSLRDFWSRRWNMAYVEMTQLLFMPVLRRKLGNWAFLAAFAISGVLHELAISVPVNAGYGGPMAYFLLHGGVTVAEGRLGVRRWPRAIGRLWAAAWVLVPLPLLFHGPFRAAMIEPLFSWGTR